MCGLGESLREPFQKVLSICVGMLKFSREIFFFFVLRKKEVVRKKDGLI